MYQYIWDPETGGLLLTTEQMPFSKEPRPVYYRELDALGFNEYWDYPKDDHAPLLWAEGNQYFYRGRSVAFTKGGSLYTKPEVILLPKPEPEGIPLQFVDIEAMCAKNAELLETLVQQTSKRIFNVYKRFKNKIDVFYVAFSGGKDSIVCLDLVSRTLPHDKFLVLFGDTQMEFPDTYRLIEETERECELQKIDFLTARSRLSPSVTWRKFGPPSTVNRWCCSVHKTAPQIHLLRKRLGKPDFTGMAFVGVRADESLARSQYDYETYGGKHGGQYSCNPLLKWNSAEIFLHIYSNGLRINEAYKKGNRRVGCLVCPCAADRNDFMNHHCYYDDSEKMLDLVKAGYRAAFPDEDSLRTFIDNGGWKARKNGRDLDIKADYQEEANKSEIKLTVSRLNPDWKEWMKTIGVLASESSPYSLKYGDNIYSFTVNERTGSTDILLDAETARSHPEFVKQFKNVFRRASCCTACDVCSANCPYGCISFSHGHVRISDSCRHCAICHRVEKGCLVYKSLEQPKGGIMVGGKDMSLNSFSHHAPKMDWIRQYFEYKDEFGTKHSLGSQMYSFFRRFLRDAGLLDGNSFSATAKVIDRTGFESETAWGIIFTNIAYNAQINWYVKALDFRRHYSRTELGSMIVQAGAKEAWVNDICASILRFSELPMGRIGFGTADKEKNRFAGICRTPWDNPIPEVILYSLYKFAEACGTKEDPRSYYQFSLSTLLDDSIERDGVSPTRIFGLDREITARILNALSINYPMFLNATFTLGLETITLRDDKTSADVLAVF